MGQADFIGRAGTSEPTTVESPREVDAGAPAPSEQSTGALVVELSELEYAVRAWPKRNAWGSAAQADVDFRSLMLRKDVVLRALRGRGLNFAEGSFDQPLRPQADVAGPDGPNTSAPDDRDATASDDRTAPRGVPAGGPADGPADGVAAAATKIENLELALATRTVIGEALGILMERHKVTPDEAFAMLRSASSVTNRKLRDVAAELADTGTLASQT